MGHIDQIVKVQPLSVTLNVRVQPSAQKEAVKGLWNQNFIKIALNAPAVDGKANEALISWLSQFFEIKKSSIFIMTGITSRSKVVSIQCSIAQKEKILEWVRLLMEKSSL